MATGCLEGDTITCPWHGFEYDIFSGELLVDTSAKLEMYPISVQDGKVSLMVPAEADPEGWASSVSGWMTRRRPAS